MNCKILDLTDEKGFLCGKILGDLGADIIKVERPSGDPARRIGPFHGNIPDPEKSLHWFAFNSSKKGITLNLEAGEGQEIFKKLSRRVDVVIESFPPGHLKNLGLGYEALVANNPRLIVTSITPFGQTGPRRHEKASDITFLAMSGLMRITGDTDRPPLRMCLDQSYYLASAHAAVGTLLALRHRQVSGEGQQVDVSIYECVVRGNYREPVRWEHEKKLGTRSGNLFSRGRISRRQLWHCKDGYVTWMLLPENPKAMRAFIEWMETEDQAGRWKGVTDESSLAKLTQEELSSLEQTIGAFISAHTLQELESKSLQRGLLLSPVRDVQGVARDEHLMFRGFWQEVEHSDLGVSITYPGFTFLTKGAENRIRSRAPHVGEHNAQVYGEELGLSPEELKALRQRGTI
jgi:crotonobetainyl-CoA:carnitine CoA-transferase CaiB-like acyl-CoA transferase